MWNRLKLQYDWNWSILPYSSMSNVKNWRKLHGWWHKLLLRHKKWDSPDTFCSILASFETTAWSNINKRGIKRHIVKSTEYKSARFGLCSLPIESCKVCSPIRSRSCIIFKCLFVLLSFQIMCRIHTDRDFVQCLGPVKLTACVRTTELVHSNKTSLKWFKTIKSRWVSPSWCQGCLRMPRLKKLSCATVGACPRVGLAPTEALHKKYEFLTTGFLSTLSWKKCCMPRVLDFDLDLYWISWHCQWQDHFWYIRQRDKMGSRVALLQVL